jgi:hypothetical protein
MKVRLSALALLLAIRWAAVALASAQEVLQYGPHHVPIYHAWQPGWDAYRFDHHHVILATVASFARTV